MQYEIMFVLKIRFYGNGATLSIIEVVEKLKII